MNVVVALVTDLLDRSKFPEGTRFVRKLDGADADVVVVVDLSVAGAVDGIAALRAAGSTARVIAYGRHTNADALRDARQAGADRVLARSAFFADVTGALT